MAVQVPSQQAFDELIYPPYELRNCHSCHYVVRGVMDFEEFMPLTEVAVYDNGHLLSRGCGLLFKGWVLVYDPQNDCTKWVRFRGSASDLSDVEIASCRRVGSVHTQRGCERHSQAGLPHREANGDLPHECHRQGSHQYFRQ